MMKWSIYVVLLLVLSALFWGYVLMQIVYSGLPDNAVYEPQERFVLVEESHKKIAVGKLMVVRRENDGKLFHAVLLAEREIPPGTQVRLSRVADRAWFRHEYDFLAIKDVAVAEPHPATR